MSVKVVRLRIGFEVFGIDGVFVGFCFFNLKNGDINKIFEGWFEIV